VALGSPLARQRWGAAFALARLGDPPLETLPVVLETLGGDDGDLRWAAAEILRRVPERARVVEALEGLLRTGNGAQRKMSLYCLRDLGARAPEIEQSALWALGDELRDVRLAAIAWLARPRPTVPRRPRPPPLIARPGRGSRSVARGGPSACSASARARPARCVGGVRDVRSVAASRRGRSVASARRGRLSDQLPDAPRRSAPATRAVRGGPCSP
jgi:hypothetical protein